jgi:hypothetical protein
VSKEEKMVKCTKEKLLQMGFQYKCPTYTYASQKRNIRVFCFNYSHPPLEHDLYLFKKEKTGSYLEHENINPSIGEKSFVNSITF